LNAALETSDPYRALGYHPADADVARNGAHGTVTTCIAAGNGLSGGPSGMAPEADIVCVHLGTEAGGPYPLESLGGSVRAREGIDFCRRVAGNRPYVISASIGRHGGPHDGLTVLDRAADFESRGNSLCFFSAGNYFSRSIHASKVLKRGDEASVRVIVDPQ